MKPKLYHRILFAQLVVLFFLLSTYHASAFSLTVTKTDVTCNGLNNGTATANTAGTNPIGTVYLWSNGATTKVISGLAPGNYSVTVSYGNSSKTGSATITQPLPLVATMSTTKTCVGACSGSAFLTISGGTPPYTRQWSNGAAGNNQNNLCAGTYSVTITDSRGCSYVVVGTVAASTFVFNVQSTPAGCTVLGTAIATVVNNSPPISFLWSNGATTSSLSNLAVGTYTLTVTNSIGCTATTSVNITPSLPVVVNVSGGTFCGTACSGIAVATATGGVGPYSFVWSNGATGSSISGLCSGTYAVTVTDSKGCSVTTSTVVNVIPLQTTVTTTNANCTGGGSANVVVTSNGVGPFSFHWSTGAQTPTISGLSPGTYSVTVTDITSGCTASATGTVGGSTGIILTTTHNNVTCGGACNGTAATTVTGGSAPFTFAWSNGATTSSVASLCPGLYAVTVYDAYGCSAANAFTITTPTAMAINTTWTNTTCVGSATGTASVVVTGGIAPYTFSWSNGATGATAFDLVEGVYCVTVADANGCTVTSCVQVDENGDPFRPSDSYVAPGCDDDCSGFILLVYQGGLWPYSYQWSNGSTESVLEDVCEGIYVVTATDANGCSLSETFEVVNYDCGGPEITLTSTNPSCGNCNGSIVATVSGGTPTFFYQWNTGDSTNFLNNLCAGTYTISVYDSNGNSGQKTVTLGSTGLQLTATTTAVCPGQCNGTAAVTVTGVGSYVVQWSNGATTTFLNNLCPGTYGVTVSDVSGCTGGTTAVVSSGLVVSTVGDSVCAGNCDGTVSVSASGGNAPYTYMWLDNASGTAVRNNLCAPGALGVIVTDATGCTAQGVAPIVAITFPQSFYYIPSTCNACTGLASVEGTLAGSYLWSTGATTSSIANLCPGNYSLSATGDNGCSNVLNFEIETTTINVNVTPTQSSTNCNGTVTATASGGTAPYFFIVGTDTFTGTLTGLCPGGYSIVAVDATGCTGWTTFGIGQTGPLSTIVTPDEVCFNSCTGALTPTIFGGLPPFSFLWSNGATTQTATDLCPGTYAVTVTDADGVTAAAFNTVSNIADPIPVTTVVNASCNGCDGSVSLLVVGGGGGYSYSWSNGATTATISNLCGGEYTVSAVNAIGCSASWTGDVVHNCRLGNDESAFENASLYPNPADGDAVVAFNSDARTNYTLELVDVLGKMLWQTNGTTNVGSNAVSIDVKVYPAGIYLLRLRNDDRTQTFKLMKQ